MSETLTPPPPPPLLPYLSHANLPQRPPVWPAYILPAALIVTQFGIGLIAGVGILIYITITGPGPRLMETFIELLASPPILLTLYSATMIVNAFAIAIPLYFSRTRPRRARVALVRPSIGIPSTIAFLLGSLAISCLFGILQTILRLPSSSLESIAHVIEAATPWQLTLASLLIALIGPILEELIFRGYIQTRLTLRHGPVLSIFLTSLFFGIFHFDLVQGAFAFFLGLYLGAIAHRAQSIIPAIICHIAVNSFSVVTTALGIDAEAHQLPIAITAALLFPPTLLLLRCAKPAPSQS